MEHQGAVQVLRIPMSLFPEEVELREKEITAAVQLTVPPVIVPEVAVAPEPLGRMEAAQPLAMVVQGCLR